MATQFYRHATYGTTYGEPMLSPSARVAWPCLVTPREAPPAAPGQTQGGPRYEITFILPKKDKGVIAWKKAVEKMCAEMLPVFNAGRKGKLSVDEVLKDGDTFDAEKYPYYADSYLLVARNAKLPPIVDGRKELLPAEKVVGGMICRATVTPLLTGHGLSYKLEALQLVKDDEVRFAGASRAGALLDMIPAVEDEDGEPTEEAEAEEAAEEETPAAPVKTGKAKALALL